MKRSFSTRMIAVGAVCAALAVIFLFLASILSTMRIACLFIASLCVCPLAFEGENAAALTCFAAAGLCALFLCAQKQFPLFYLAFLGHYPVFRLFIERRVLSKALALLCKALYGNLFLALGYLLLDALGMLPFSHTPELVIVIVVSCNVGLIALEFLYRLILSHYHTHIRTHLFPYTKI